VLGVEATLVLLAMLGVDMQLRRRRRRRGYLLGVDLGQRRCSASTCSTSRRARY
jgi:hypothetical protein